MKKILVTGGAGYIGAVLTGMLVERGYDVRVVDRLYWGAGPLARWKEHVELIKGDVRSMSDALLDGVDGVVHLAGLSNDPTAEYNPGANWEMNTVATKSLAEACKRAGIDRAVRCTTGCRRGRCTTKRRACGRGARVRHRSTPVRSR